MRRLLVCAGLVMLALLCFSQMAHAGGICMEGVGTRAVTMGGAFTGLADDASAVFWNPAGLAQLKGGRFELGLYTMHTMMWDRDSVSNLPIDQQNPAKGDIFPALYDSEPNRFNEEELFWPGCATIPYLVSYKTFDDFTLGGGIYALGGSYSDFEDTGIKDMETGADIDAMIWTMMMIMNVNVSLSKKITDKLSLGVGLDILYGKLKGDLDKDYKGSNDPTRPDYEFRFESESDGMGVQGTVGCHYQCTPKLSVGAVYKTGSEFDLNGVTHGRMTLFQPDGTPIMNLSESSNHYHDFVYPPYWAVGIAYRYTPRLVLTADWQRTDWTNFNWPLANLNYETQGNLLRDVVVDPDFYSANAYRFGCEYLYNERLTLRGGYMYDESGVPEDGQRLTSILLGEPVHFYNAGIGYEWDVWKMDLMVGTMFGESYVGSGHQ